MSYHDRIRQHLLRLCKHHTTLLNFIAANYGYYDIYLFRVSYANVDTVKATIAKQNIIFHRETLSQEEAVCAVKITANSCV